MDKLYLKNQYDQNHQLSNSVFDDYVKQNKIKDWVDKFLPFLDDNTRFLLTNHYNEKFLSPNKFQ